MSAILKGADFFFQPESRTVAGIATSCPVPMSLPWILLMLAAACEVAWAIGLKFTEGFTRFWPSVFTLGTMALSVVLLGQAMKSVPTGTAYAVWTGLGAAGTATLGMVLLGEPVNALRIASLGLILAGVAGLKLAAG